MRQLLVATGIVCLIASTAVGTFAQQSAPSTLELRQPQSAPTTPADGYGAGSNYRPGQAPNVTQDAAPATPEVPQPPVEPKAQPTVPTPPTNGYDSGRADRPLPVPPSAQQPAPTYVNPFAAAQGTIDRPLPQFQPNPPAAPATVPQKPFSGYSPPPALSPYINLFRRDTDFGVINNYYSLVRPMLEQSSYNRKVENEIGSLERATQRQSQVIRQLDQRTEYLQGLPPTGSYPNFQNYYPGYQGPER